MPFKQRLAAISSGPRWPEEAAVLWSG